MAVGWFLAEVKAKRIYDEGQMGWTGLIEAITCSLGGFIGGYHLIGKIYLTCLQMVS